MESVPLDFTYELPAIAPCEHIAGNEKFIRKAFEIQARFLAPNGKSLVDVTLDLEDGAPVGQEDTLRDLVLTLITSPANSMDQAGIRVHAPCSPHFERDLFALTGAQLDSVKYITIPKVSDLREALWAVGLMERLTGENGAHIAVHILIETPGAVRDVGAIARIPRVQVLDFGLMDFISHLSGAIPGDSMYSPGQFDHAILSRVKSDIALAALGNNKIPSHNVTVDVRNPEAAFLDAERARRQFGFLRMWSIHPLQIEPIIRAMTPTPGEVETAKRIIDAARAASWGPVSLDGRLHDRASYRYFWGILSRSANSR